MIGGAWRGQRGAPPLKNWEGGTGWGHLVKVTHVDCWRHPCGQRPVHIPLGSGLRPGPEEAPAPQQPEPASALRPSSPQPSPESPPSLLPSLPSISSRRTCPVHTHISGIPGPLIHPLVIVSPPPTATQTPRGAETSARGHGLMEQCPRPRQKSNRNTSGLTLLNDGQGSEKQKWAKGFSPIC